MLHINEWQVKLFRIREENYVGGLVAVLNFTLNCLIFSLLSTFYCILTLYLSFEAGLIC